jgi:hypothetical protein
MSQGRPSIRKLLYDTLSRVTKVIPPDGSAASNNAQYSYYGNTVTITDPAGKQRKNYSDALGRLVRVDEPGGSPASGAVTITGSEQSMCDPDVQPPKCVTIYDLGTVTVTIGGFSKSVNYVRASTPSSIASALRTAFNGDSSSPATASVTGAAVTFTSVQSGNSANYIVTTDSQSSNPNFDGPSFDANGPSALSGGSDNGSPGSLVNPFATFYTYDVMDNLIQVNQGVQQRNYVYSGLARLTSAQTPESGLVTYSYQNGGAPCSSNVQNDCQRTDARNIATTYQYDSLNRLQNVTYSDGTPSVTYSYDAGGAPAFALGRLTSMVDGTVSETYTYDNLGRIKQVDKVISGSLYSTKYQYNYVGAMTKLTYPNNGVVNQAYDAAGRAHANQHRHYQLPDCTFRQLQRGQPSHYADLR